MVQERFQEFSKPITDMMLSFIVESSENPVEKDGDMEETLVSLAHPIFQVLRTWKVTV